MRRPMGNNKPAQCFEETGNKDSGLWGIIYATACFTFNLVGDWCQTMSTVCG